MKAILEFTLPEESSDLDLARSAHELAANLVDVANHIRAKLKHGELTNGQTRQLEAVRDLIDFELLSHVGYY